MDTLCGDENDLEKILKWKNNGWKSRRRTKIKWMDGVKDDMKGCGIQVTPE